MLRKIRRALARTANVAMQHPKVTALVVTAAASALVTGVAHAGDIGGDPAGGWWLPFMDRIALWYRYIFGN